ncbi:vomeronasal type-2 receptor 26-like [Xenopus laevis]|uniref:Vomeronasal type-2 receptor 26-like n=1 Tax=Xenopus laevis TaxID=8355 RepID=A0A8J1MYA3_XENLA|nr:vomeronasal type-2 receptor 26-like [Xenopus laevis]
MDMFQDLVEQDLKKLNTSTTGRIKWNISLEERTALRSLRSATNITIRQADKGGSVVVMNTADYIAEAKRQLNDCETYSTLSFNPQDKFMKAIEELVSYGEEQLTDIEAFNQELHTSNMLIAAHALSFASGLMHFMQTLHNKPTAERNKKVIQFRYQLHHVLKGMKFPMQGPFMKSFDLHGELVSSYQVINVYVQPNQFIAIAKIPRAQCSDNCLRGFRKATKPGAPFCCYDCVLCSEGEISNITDSKNCIRCPDLESPNEKRNQCIAKSIEFLSYNDVISELFSFISLVLVVLILLILGVFISHWNTTIVRANNRSLSFLLLVSIKLSFLSVFLFLGRPVDINCMLRNITFGITFSIAISSLLAKTIMVYVAFKATKPGSSWRKWVGANMSNSVVLFCSSIQIIICMTWLAISPPFQELDLHTYPGTIIIQCNEGSAIGFYSVIGYMGLLAAVSFVLAFLARTLPDSFNEAKYITFSMLLFCSVWITMIPAYLSTKGKNTVCVEIFAILTSSAGLLFCIFLPKCYIILFKPEINTKSHVIGNKALYST